MSEIYIQHHGVKGMRWGVRRYQRKDGSLTSAGKKRYAKLESIRNSQVELARRQRSTEERRLKANEDLLKSMKEEGPENLVKRMYSGEVENDADAKALYGMSMKDLFNDEISWTEHDSSVMRSRIKGYLAKEQALLNMSIDDLNIKRKDIIAVGMGAMVEAWAEDD